MCIRDSGQNRGTGPDCLVEVVIATSDLYDRLLDAFAEDPNADTGRVGVTGFSMGAMTAFYYAANGRHPVTAAAPCCGTPDFTEPVSYTHLDVYKRQDSVLSRRSRRQAH